MGTIKAVLWGVPNKDGKFPIKIRITKDRKPKYIGTGYHIEKKDWNPKRSQVRSSVLNHAIINDRIQTLIINAQLAEGEMVRNKEVVTSRKIKEKSQGGQALDFFEYAETYLTNLLALGKGLPSLSQRMMAPGAPPIKVKPTLKR